MPPHSRFIGPHAISRSGEISSEGEKMSERESAGFFFRQIKCPTEIFMDQPTISRQQKPGSPSKQASNSIDHPERKKVDEAVRRT